MENVCGSGLYLTRDELGERTAGTNESIQGTTGSRLIFPMDCSVRLHGVTRAAFDASGMCGV